MFCSLHSIPAHLTRPWTIDANNEAEKNEQAQEMAASTDPAYVFAYYTDSK